MAIIHRSTRIHSQNHPRSHQFMERQFLEFPLWFPNGEQNSAQSNACRQKSVLCVDEETNCRLAINVRERRPNPTQRLVKRFILRPPWGRRTAKIRGSGKNGSYVVERRASMEWQRSSCKPITASTNKWKNNQGRWWLFLVTQCSTFTSPFPYPMESCPFSI